MLHLISALFILLLTPVNAMAVEINDQGAAKLKSSFQEFLDYQKMANEAFGSLEVIYKGNLDVKQNEGFYTVTFPHISVKGEELIDGEAKHFTLEIGVITINALPDDEDNYWKMMLSLPNKITLSDNSSDDLVIELKEQNIVAMFNDKLSYFTKTDMSLSGISAKEGDKDTGINIGNIKYYLNMTENENGTFSGPSYLSISDVNITPPEERKEGSIKIGEVKFNFTMSDFNLLTLKEYSNKFAKHAETFNSLSDLEQDEAPENINSDDVVDMVFDLYDLDMDGFDFEYSLKDLEIYAGENDKDFDSLKLGSMFFGLGIDGLNTGKGGFNIKTGYDNINIAPIDPEYSDLFPQNANIGIKATNIPYTILSDLGVNTVKTITKNPDNASMAGLVILMRLPAILSQSGAEITFEQNGIKNDIYALTLDGNITADLTAIMGLSAKFKAVFKGLDNVLTIANKYATNPQNGKSGEFLSLSKTLETLKGIGKSKNGDYIFEFETTPEGTILVNGKDSSDISFD